jgi:predicted DNA-binding protein YlxM (UPF0122 family)
MPAKPKKNGRQNYDWNLMMMDYIDHQDLSLRKIAEKYDVSFNAVKAKAKADSWFATKQKHIERKRTKAATKLVTKGADELVGLVTASDYIEKAILKAINSPDYFNRHLVSRNLNEEEDTLTILNTKAMKDMMRVIKDVEDVKRSILDIKRSDTAERLALERERLELEKERLALERERNALRNGNISSEDNMRYGVVLIPEVIDNE